MMVNLLEHAAERAPTLGVGYVADDGSVEVEPYPALLHRAACVLAGLRSRGLHAGDQVVLALNRNESFLAAFWGCLLGGIIPAPVGAPAGAANGGGASARLLAVRRALGDPVVVVEDETADREHVWSFADLSADRPDLAFHRPDPGDTAFLQFSSGSTGEPKGVVLSHRNVLANVTAIHQGLGAEPDEVGVNWLPLHHDMGLIGFHLTPLLYARPQYHLHPATMIRRPLVWLDTLERLRGTITACPNFGQALLLSRLERSGDRHWDLSSVRLVLNGAEPIAPSLMRRFQERLSRFGLRESAMLPVYGMAESTLAVTFPAVGPLPRVERLDRRALQREGRAAAASPEDPTALEMVSVGSPLAGGAVRIVDGSDRTLPADTVGHIQVKGDSVTSGYVGSPVDGNDLFCDGWLRSGDLGFERDGCLFITGRAKDVVFVNGQNFHAHDLEQVAAQVPGVSPHRVAVCGLHDERAEGERLLLFLTARSPESALPFFMAVNRQFQETLGITADVLIPLKADQMPRSTSGKLQRYRLRELFLEGAFEAAIDEMSRARAAAEPAVARTRPRSPTESLLHEVWCAALHLPADRIGVTDDFTHLGGTSLQALSIVSELEERLGLQVHSAALADHATIAALAAYLDRHRAGLTSLEAGRATYFRG